MAKTLGHQTRDSMHLAVAGIFYHCGLSSEQKLRVKHWHKESRPNIVTDGLVFKRARLITETL